MEQLKKLFGDRLIYSDIPYQFEVYKWFRAEDYTFIGIEQSAISPRERELLSIFLTPYEQTNHALSPDQIYWFQLLFEDTTTTIAAVDSCAFIRFTHFSIKRLFEQKLEFEDALTALYATPITILWDDHNSGVVIEKVTDAAEITKDLIDAVDVLSNDFETDIQFFEGQLYALPVSPSKVFHLEKSWFQRMKGMFEQEKVIQLSRVLPYLLVHEVSLSVKQQMNQMIALVKEDSSLLETIKCYLECNLNVSLAAKKLYMHRNSLQYRIDKFIDRTNIDIKHFHGAVSAYLAILAAESADRN
ncbi:transcriptional regulator [Priestia megaterium]|nr:transcriptional regulator [Priestia megaterium]